MYPLLTKYSRAVSILLWLRIPNSCRILVMSPLVYFRMATTWDGRERRAVMNTSPARLYLRVRR